MSDLAVAYAMKRRGKSMPVTATEPEKMTEGGEVCSHCGMSKGSMIDEPEIDSLEMEPEMETEVAEDKANSFLSKILGRKKD